MKKKVVLAGGSGFLGQSLADFLVEKGYEVVILSRQARATIGPINYVQWDGKYLDDWAHELEGSFAIVNFTGKSVNCIYNKPNREEIISSRIDSVRVLEKAIKNCTSPPQAFIQASSLAIFGNTKALCDEEAPHGTGFSVDVCEQWEAEFFKPSYPSTRQVLLRIGFALGKNGGALEPLKKLAHYNLGGTIGSGEQYISWLHLDDLNQMILRAIVDPELEGIYNATGPSPITNKEFMRTLRKVMRKGWAPPAPTPLVWLGAYLFMKVDPGLALTGRKCVPKKFLDNGFEFKFTDLKVALQDLI